LESSSRTGGAVALHAVTKKLLDEGFLLVLATVDVHANVGAPLAASAFFPAPAAVRAKGSF
jgi:hypothetical protein